MRTAGRIWKGFWAVLGVAAILVVMGAPELVLDALGGLHGPAGRLWSTVVVMCFLITALSIILASRYPKEQGRW